MQKERLNIEQKERPQNNGRCIILTIVLIIIFLCIGIGIGYAIGKNKYEDEVTVETGKKEMQNEEEILAHHKNILNRMKADNIKENLRHLTELPHYPGGDQVKKLGDEILKNWKEQGFDRTEEFKYNIYLSFPEKPGEISTMNGSTIERKFVINNEPPFDESEKKGKILFPFNAFSGAGTVTAELVYGNYGRDSDFEAVKDAGVEVSGKIMIFRYGKTSRTMKVKRAEERGVIGVIIFSDPYDHTYAGKIYPQGWTLNKYGVQRGTINRLAGDSLSIGYPSKDRYFRINKSKYSGNPKIPSQPISYSTAYEILRWMNNNTIPLPNGFQGGLNFTYSLYSGISRNVTLTVSTKLETRSSYTVCGTLYGSTEPDRYILIGNHRDAWTYGAADPSSGTATMMEIVRAIGDYKKTGWRPHRSIMACSWGAEEPGILGSTEWADENHKFLTEKVALYLNVDMAVEGNFTFRIKALNMLKDGVFEVTKRLQAADDPSKTLYQDWKEKSAILENKTLTEPRIVFITSGSDYKPMWHSYGTPCADLRYMFSKVDYSRLPINPHYHTMYESFGWMSKHVDPTFRYHLTVGKVWAGYALSIADANIISYDLTAYSQQVKYYLGKFEKRYKDMLDNHTISLSFAHERVDALISKTEKFHKHVKDMKEKDKSPYKLRAINDKIMNFERNFLLKGLLKSTTTARHVVFSTGYNTLYSERFPGISEAIFYASKDPKNDWDEVRKQITYVIWCFDTAIRSLDLNE